MDRDGLRLGLKRSTGHWLHSLHGLVLGNLLRHLLLGHGRWHPVLLQDCAWLRNDSRRNSRCYYALASNHHRRRRHLTHHRRTWHSMGLSRRHSEVLNDRQKNQPSFFHIPMLKKYFVHDSLSDARMAILLVTLTFRGHSLLRLE